MSLESSFTELYYNGCHIRGCAPPISDNRSCFGEPFVSETMVLCRIRYYFVAVMGLGSTLLLTAKSTFISTITGNMLLLVF